jgi:nucleoside phosphorylase
LDEFIIPKYWYYLWLSSQRIECYIGKNIGLTFTYPLHEYEDREAYSPYFICVDTESHHVGGICNYLKIPFVSIRYAIDKIDKKCKPAGINHFWRKYQHYRMQTKFNRMLKDGRLKDEII